MKHVVLSMVMLLLPVWIHAQTAGHTERLDGVSGLVGAGASAVRITRAGVVATVGGSAGIKKYRRRKHQCYKKQYGPDCFHCLSV